jgi:hypothetical protein
VKVIVQYDVAAVNRDGTDFDNAVTRWIEPSGFKIKRNPAISLRRCR